MSDLSWKNFHIAVLAQVEPIATHAFLVIEIEKKALQRVFDLLVEAESAQLERVQYTTANSTQAAAETTAREHIQVRPINLN